MRGRAPTPPPRPRRIGRRATQWASAEGQATCLQYRPVKFVPRLRDTLTVRRLIDGETVLFVISNNDREIFRLTGDGWHLLTLLDGVSSLETVQERYREHVGREIPLEELESFCGALSDAGVLNTTDRAVHILAYLRDQGVLYRAGRPDRREVNHPDSGSDEDPRSADRRSEGATAGPFQVGVAHLNEGRLEQGLATFRVLAEESPGDVRVGELLGHLEYLAAADANPSLTEDRRDPTWDAFDRALVTLLAAGRCPGCEAEIEVALYKPNRCRSCGASFTATALRRSDANRRGDA